MASVLSSFISILPNLFMCAARSSVDAPRPRFDLSFWATCPSVKGQKEEAVKRIEEAFNGKTAVLDLSNLGLNSIPDCIAEMDQLEVLQLNGNDLSALPAQLGNLPKLSALYLEYNKRLAILPKTLCKSLTLRCITTGGTGIELDHATTIGSIFETIAENSKRIALPCKKTIDPAHLFYSQRPRAVQDRIDSIYSKLSHQGKNWLYNGSRGAYGLLNFRDEEVIAQRIFRAPPEKSDLYFIDLGSGYHHWVDWIQAFLLSNYQHDARHFHVIGVTGEGEPGHFQHNTDNVTTHKISGFKLENLWEEFPKLDLHLESSVEFIATSWTLRHLVDPVGTLDQAYHLLSPGNGLIFGTGFDGCCGFAGKHSLGETLSLAFGPHHFIARKIPYDSQEQFALFRSDEGPSRIETHLKYNEDNPLTEVDGFVADSYASCFATLSPIRFFHSSCQDFGNGFYGFDTSVLHELLGDGIKPFS